MNRNEELIKYMDKLYSAALHKSGDSYVAEELVQDVCLAALQAFSKGKEPENLWAWLMAVLSNKHCDLLRRRYNEPVISFEGYPLDIPGEDEADDTAEQLEAIRCELGYLAQTHREVMLRYYIHGETVEKIAAELKLPVGTVKSRLHTGRKQLKKGIDDMENYTTNSYAPDKLIISCSGSEGFHNEPFSLVDYSDTLAQNILLLAYQKPVTVVELAKALGVPAPFIEPILKRLMIGELMKETDGGKVYTDFIIYTDKDRKATLQKQLEVVQTHFCLFWEDTAKGILALREQEYYKRQTQQAKTMLELHFCIKVLLHAHVEVRSEVTGDMAQHEYPYRKDGGRWLAIGNQYSHDHRKEEDADLQKCSISGEGSISTKNYRDTVSLELREYSTVLGSFPRTYYNAEYLKWLYEVYSDINYLDSADRKIVPEAVGDFVDYGILNRDKTLSLAIPVLTKEEYQAECALAREYKNKVYCKIRDVLLPVFEKGYVRLPAHLKSVPKWQQYMYCGDSVPMAVIHKAIGDGLLFEGVEHPIPAAILVVEKQS